VEVKKMMERDEAKRRRKLVAIVMVIIFLGIIFVPIFAATMFFTIGVGEAALLVDPLAKTVSQPIIGPTWSTKFPWVSVIKIFYATDSYEDTIPCFTSDQLEMSVLIQIRWSLDINRIHDLYLSYPTLNYKKTIESITEQIMKTVTKNYTALETISLRSEVIDKIQIAVLDALKNAPSLQGALASLEFNLRDIGYPAAYTQAIEAKLIAEQQKIQAEFERERIITLANASAQEVLIKAVAESQAKIVVAQGTRQAIENIMRSAGVTNSTRIAELYLWVEAMKQLNIGTFIIVTGQNGVPLIYQLPSNSTAP
jgi:regulator of protease activity HflC (stomatin/prohibitin superfamily)